MSVNTRHGAVLFSRDLPREMAGNSHTAIESRKTGSKASAILGNGRERRHHRRHAKAVRGIVKKREFFACVNDGVAMGQGDCLLVDHIPLLVLLCAHTNSVILNSRDYGTRLTTLETEVMKHY